MSKSPVKGRGLRRTWGSASKKCLMAALMVTVLAVSCFVLVNDSDESDAANAQHVRINVPDINDNYVFEDGQGLDAYAPGWSVHYEDGIFTLDDSDDPTGFSFYDWVDVADVKASLYADGDLTLVLKGTTPELRFDPYQSDTYATYGIYVTGNLTIINDTSVSVDRVLRLHPGSSYTNSAGIYCGGSLTIQNNSSHSFTVDAKGGDSGYDSSYTSNDSNQTNGYRTYGIQAENGVSVGSNVTLNAAGGDVSFCTKKGVTCSLGILSGTYQTGNEGLTYYTDVNGKAIDIAAGGKIVATGGSINVSSSDSANTSIYPTVSAGIGGGAMTVNGSEIDYDPDDPDTVAVKATGGSLAHIEGVDGGSGGTSYGMWLGTLTVNGGNVVSDGGVANLSMNMKCESYGLWTSREITVNSNGKLIANAGESWRESFGIYTRNSDEEDRSIIVNGGYVEGNADFVVSRGEYFGASTGIYATRILYADGGTVIGRGGVSIDESLTPIGINASAVSLSNGASVTGYGGDCKSTYAATIYDVGSGGTVKDSIGIRLTETSHSVGEGSVLAGIGGAMITGSGTGSLGGASYGILFSNSGTVSITGSGTVNATGGTVPYNPVDHNLYPGYNLESIGMHSRGALTISGITVNATGGTVCTGNNFAKYCGSVSRGLDTESDLVLTNGATVNATGGVNEKYSTNVEQKADYNDSYGAYVNGSISVSASVLNATAGSASRMVGIIVNGSITLTNDATVRVVSDSTIRNGLVNNLSDLQGYAYGVAILNSDESADIVVTAGTFRCEAGVTVKSTNSGNTLGAAHIAYGSSPSSVSTTTESMEFSSLSHDEFFLARSAQYTVTFDANGGSGTMDAIPALGKFTLPACSTSPFTNPGHTLVGWIVGSPSGDEYGAFDQVIILSDTVVYAKWAAVPTYDVSFTNEGGLTLSVKIGDADARALTDGEITAGKITAIPEGTVVKFTAAAITGYDLFYQANDGEVTALGTGYQFTVSGACSIAFTKAPHKYTATFNLSGGTVASIPSGWTLSAGVYTKDFDYGTSKAAIISDFGAYSKVGHTKGAETASADTMGVDGMTITATWTPIKYTATFNLSGGTVASTPTGWAGSDGVYTKDFDYGTSKADIIDDFGDYSKVGHTKGAETASVDTMGVDGMTITANWNVNNYTVTLNLSGGQLANTPTGWGYRELVYYRTFAYGTPYTDIIASIVYNSASISPSKTGYTFSGWEPDSGTLGASAATLTATYTLNKYTATFNLSGGTVASTPSGWTLSNGVYTKSFDYSTPKATIISDFGAYTKVGYTKGAETVSVDTMGVDGMSITANWTPIKYTITFLNYNGDELQSDLVDYGTVPSYTGDTPTKPQDAQYVYTHNGWTPLITAVTGDATYTATFSGTTRSYTVTFENEDGTELQSETLLYGTMPEYKGNTPTKASTAQYSYNFAGWDSEIVSVTGDATYTATYGSTVNKYTIRFVNYDGTQLQSGLVNYGATPTYTGATPTKPSDAQYDYAFAGWDNAIVSVISDATYMATYDSSLRSYTIRFVNYNETELQSGSVAYGSTPVYSGDTPAKAADAYFTYTFAGWDPAIAAVTGAATYTATFDSARIPYTISFATTEGGSGSMANVVVDSGDYVLPANGFTPAAGKVFEGWAYGSASGQVYLANAHCDIHENVTFYAKWSDHQHTLVSIPAVPASCTESGLTEGFRCSECGQIIVAQVTVDALGHDHVAVVTEPTCTTGGYTTHTCSRCGDSYVDDEVPALGHSWGEWQITRAPTCTQAGEKTRTCAHDGTHTETESIPVIDHDYVAVVTAPTCTEKGFTTHTCSMCGDSYVDTYVDELGHTWASAEYTWSADGKTCTVIVICGTDNHRQTVPDVAVTSSVKTAATTSSMGVTAYAVNGTYQGFAYSSTKDVSDIPALEAAPTVKEGTSTYENEVAENVETAVTNTFSTAKDAGGEVELSVPTTAAGSMTIAFDNAAVNAIGGNEVRLQATVKENVAEIADAALVIEVTLSGATFSDGKAKVTVPFSQSVPEGKTLKVYFINGDQRQDMNATLVDGNVVFETNHFSTYAIVFEDAPSSSDNNGGGFPIWIVAVIAIVAIAAVSGAFFFIQQKKKA